LKKLAALTAIILLATCSEEPPPPPVVEVVVAEVVLEPYQPRSRYVGRLQAQDDVAIQAQVTGYLTSRQFRQGGAGHGRRPQGVR